MPTDISLIDAPSFYRPGGVVRAVAAWRLDRPPKRVEAKLIWTTAGKGTTDAVAVATETNPSIQPADEWHFAITIPPGAPPTYDGRLVSVRWSLRIDTGRAADSAAVDFLVSPTGEPIVPQRLTNEAGEMTRAK